MDNEPLNLNDMELDALKEVGNIGAGHAATALSQLCNQQIMITVPDVGLKALGEIPLIFGDEEKIVAAIYMKVAGDIFGRCLLLFPRESALVLANILLNQDEIETVFLGEMECSALKEAGNILMGAFISALADFLNLNMLPTVPVLAYDMIGPILASLAIDYVHESNNLFCLQTLFSSSENIHSNFLVIFDTKTLNILINKLRKIVSI